MTFPLDHIVINTLFDMDRAAALMSGASPSRPEAPAPLRRRGPRPLLLHLTLAMLRSTASLAASPSWSAGSPTSNAAAAEVAEALARRGAGESFPQAVLEEALRQDSALIAGIAAYRRHPFQRSLPDPPTLWAEDDTRLLDFGGEG